MGALSPHPAARYYPDVTESEAPTTRQRILDAALGFITEHPAGDMPLRAVCQAAGTQLPTLYRYFGSKSGLLLELENIGFTKLVALTESFPSHDDFFDDVRDYWDHHVEFGMENPGLYILMYGQLEPSSIRHDSRIPEIHAAERCADAERQGLLSVSADRAAAHIMCNCIGATLRFICYGAVDRTLSDDICEATLAAISSAPPTKSTSPVSTAAGELLRALSHDGTELAPPELELLRHWLRTM
jgi:AcrR family transcriptional regulator